MYEFKSIMLNETGQRLSMDDLSNLNKYFDDGWEYVDSISQSASVSIAGSTYNSYDIAGKVAVVLKRKVKFREPL